MYKNILVAIDLNHGELGARLLKVARFLAAGGGKVTLLNVVQPLPSYVGVQAPKDVVETHRKETEEKLNELAAGAGGVDQVITGLGSAGNEILEEAARIGADAIVVGSHKPGLTDYLIGSTAARVVRHAPCTVVVERSKVT